MRFLDSRPFYSIFCFFFFYKYDHIRDRHLFYTIFLIRNSERMNFFFFFNVFRYKRCPMAANVYVVRKLQLLLIGISYDYFTNRFRCFRNDNSG